MQLVQLVQLEQHLTQPANLLRLFNSCGKVTDRKHLACTQHHTTKQPSTSKALCQYCYPPFEFSVMLAATVPSQGLKPFSN